ncbi:single-stranded DNA-binding protein [Streptomyces sp. AMCC400023]|uniref:single-stranded DNA-binding protein n=1 Tax=Streptomyces sp. AMCC400023 TaxID=2056258 RepID=UPI001F2A9414|nr:single-stranded DNA-binding protein [Streptomyces sp. AMCC400023]UJV41599.1 single-stranded DNA-binding protein [Streptomyces sp. AMCC400023]
MAGETVITVVGNLVDDPELRFTPSGVAVAKFRIASTPRVFDKQASEWKDGDALFLTCSVWRQAAENVAESLGKGARVIVQGRLKQRSYEDGQGVKRTVCELDVDEVGPTLARAIAKVTKNPAGGGQRQAGVSGETPDPWANARPTNGQQQGGGWGGAQQQQPAAQGAGYSDEPPF